MRRQKRRGTPKRKRHAAIVMTTATILSLPLLSSCGRTPAPAARGPAARAEPALAPFVNDTRTYGDERDGVQPLDQMQLQGLQRFRETEGLDPSERLIRSLYADMSHAVVRHLALYTPAEAAKLDKRLDLQQDERVMTEYAAANGITSKALLVLDPKAADGNGALLVYSNDVDFDRHAAELRRILPHPDRVILIRSQWSQDQLQEMTARAAELAGKYPHPTWQLASAGFDRDARPEVVIVGNVKDAEAFFDQHRLRGMSYTVTDKVAGGRRLGLEHGR